MTLQDRIEQIAVTPFNRSTGWVLVDKADAGCDAYRIDLDGLRALSRPAVARCTVQWFIGEMMNGECTLDHARLLFAGMAIAGAGRCKQLVDAGVTPVVILNTVTSQAQWRGVAWVGALH